jgi:hypothetical protein
MLFSLIYLKQEVAAVQNRKGNVFRCVGRKAGT